MNSPLGIIISREYLERVKRKSFIVSTILVPIFMIAIMLAPAAMMVLSTPETATVAVLDHTGRIAPLLHGNSEITFKTSTASADSLRANEANDIIVVIGPDAIDRPQRDITVYSRGALSMMTDAYITNQLNRAIEDVRLEAYNMGNIRQIMNEVEVDCSYPAIRIDREEETASSSTASYFIALCMDMMLYMFILIYGQMVMNSIIEEKNNRVLELVVSSVKPKTLMLGKIMGVGLVAITQILIWGAILGVCTAWLVPAVGNMAGAEADPEIVAAIAQLSDPGFVLNLFVFMILFFIGGYLFYSAIYAAIASAVDNIQDAGQLSTVATLPVIVGIVASMSVLTNPNNTFAFWISIIPFTSPMAMMARLPFGVPLWEELLSLMLLYASFMFLIWLCAKIYRVGIFMYGKKPTLIEIIKWARYK